MGILKVKEEFRGKGYGSIVAASLAAHLWDLGITPIAYVENENEGAVKLFTKLGFKKNFMASWLLYYPEK